MEFEREYFIKSIIVLLILSSFLFLYLKINIKKSKLNRELSVNTNSYIELKSEISKLEIEYNKLIRNEVLKEKALKFNMHLPEAVDIIRIKYKESKIK